MPEACSLRPLAAAVTGHWLLLTVTQRSIPRLPNQPNNQLTNHCCEDACLAAWGFAILSLSKGCLEAFSRPVWAGDDDAVRLKTIV
jgi:hypothetical protein